MGASRVFGKSVGPSGLPPLELSYKTKTVPTVT